MKKSIYKAALLSALVYVCTAAWPLFLLAEEGGHEQHGKHVHGEGELRLVLENQDLQLEFIVPAMNVVGFEYEAKSDEQKRSIQEAIAILKDKNRVFVLPSEAGCELQTAEVHYAVLGKEEHEEDMHHEDEEHHEEHESSHAEFKSHYAYQCSTPDELKSIEMRVFQEFEGIENIDVEMIVSSKQSSQELAANQTVIKLKECRFGFGSWCLF